MFKWFVFRILENCTVLKAFLSGISFRHEVFFRSRPN